MLEEQGGFAFPVDSPRERAFTATPSLKPHHQGHRRRLRDRAAISFAAVPDYELLELILTRGLRRGDVKPTAKALLARFGGLAGVFGAGLEELTAIKGVGPSLALDLKLLHEATVRIGRGEVTKRTVISSWSALLAYAKVAMAHEAREQFRVLFLDKKTNQASRAVRAGPGIPSRQRLVGRDASLRVQARSIQSNLLVG